MELLQVINIIKIRSSRSFMSSPHPLSFVFKLLVPDTIIKLTLTLGGLMFCRSLVLTSNWYKCNTMVNIVKTCKEYSKERKR